MYNLALIGQAASEEKIFEYYRNIEVSCPGMEIDVPLVSISFQNHLNDILTVFPIQMHRRPMLTLLKNRSRSSQGHNLYIHCST